MPKIAITACIPAGNTEPCVALIPSVLVTNRMMEMCIRDSNTLWASLAGGHEDDQALKDPDGNYGYLIEELGARILQTDRRCV